MEEPKRKKEWTQKPFKIENDELRQKGIVDSKYRLIGKNGAKLRIAKNNYTGEIKMVYKNKNWQEEYQQFFNSLDDKWARLYSFTKPVTNDKCNEQKIEFCRKKGKVCNPITGRCNNPKKNKTKKNFLKNSQNKTKKIKTKKSKTQRSEIQRSEPQRSQPQRSEPQRSVPQRSEPQRSETKNIGIREDLSSETPPLEEVEKESVIEIPQNKDIISLQRQMSVDSLNESQPSVREVISYKQNSVDNTLQEERKEIEKLMDSQSLDSQSLDSESKSVSISKQDFKEQFNEECQNLINSLKEGLHKLSIQSKEYQKLLKCTSNKNREQIVEYKKLDKLLYPHLDDPNFAYKIARKKEFRDVEIPKKSKKQIENIENEANKLCNPNLEFELDPHQKFVRNFLSFQSPYNSILLFHGLGTGKTCSSISVCEEMRTYYQQIGSTKKIIIVASPVVQENYKLQLFDERKLKLINGLWNLKACTGNKYIKEVNPMNTKGLSKERVIKQIKKIIRQSYEFLGYTEFANKINKLIKKVSGNDDKKIKLRQRRIIEKEFSDRLLVIDEVHNIRSNDIKRRTTKNMLDLVSYAKNMKLLLLTATPMFNEATEIVWLANLMNLNDKRFPISIKDIFDSNGNFIKNENFSGRDLLIQKLNGYVSYVSGENPFTFPFRIFPYEFNSPNSLKILKNNDWQYPKKQINGLEIKPDNQINYLDIYINKLESFQTKAYKYIIEKLKKKYPLLQEKKQGIQYTMMDGPLQILNIAYPHEDLLKEDYNDKNIEKELYGKKGLKRIMNYNKSSKKDFEYKQNTLDKFGRIFSSDGEEPLLKKYSSKIYQFIKKVKESKGICLIYSNFIGGGCVPIALALEEMGIYRYDTSKSLFKNKTHPPYKINGNNAKYIMITGDKKLSPNNKQELKAATDPKNLYGEKVKVIIISKAGSEGLDFKNIRQVHILEPWYNLNRADQTIGRGVRKKSHCQLPFNERTVEVYLHASEIQETDVESIDMYIYRTAETKAIKIGKVTRLLKENAVDCLVNKNQQQMNSSNIGKNIQLLLSNDELIDYQIGHKDNSLICDFMECNYLCKPNNELSDEIGIETYNQNYIVMNIEKILNKIKLLFKEHYIYEKSELIKRITSMKAYSMEQINTALDILINDNNEFLIDMLGRSGRLINVDKYYMFQPLEFSENYKTSLYKKRHPIEFKNKYLSFNPKSFIQKTKSKIPISKKSYDLEFYNFYENYTILLDRNTKDKKSWVLSAGNAINNIYLHNDIPKEILIVLALEHLFEVYDTKTKIKLLNEFEAIKNDQTIIDKDILPDFDPQFLNVFQQIIDKYSIDYENITIVPLVNYKKDVFNKNHGFIKLNKNITPNQWTTNVSGISVKFVELMNSKFITKIENINNFIGFLTIAKNKIVFKVKSITSSEHKRTNKGQQLPTSGENKSRTIDRLNKIWNIINPEKSKYKMDSTNTKIQYIYEEETKFPINDMELAVELELLLRYLDLNKLNNKKWFFNTLEDKLNDVENIKI